MEGSGLYRSKFMSVKRVLTHTAVNLFGTQECCLLVLSKALESSRFKPIFLLLRLF